MTIKISGSEFTGAAFHAERSAGAANAAVWMEPSNMFLDHQRDKILDGLKFLAKLHGLALVDAGDQKAASEQQIIENLHFVIKQHHATIRRLVDADPHAADAALAGIKSVQP